MKGLSWLLAALSFTQVLGNKTLSSSAKTRSGSPTSSGRFNLSGLPPAWKGRVQQRKLSGKRK